MTGRPARATIREVPRRSPASAARHAWRPSGSVLRQERASFTYAFAGLRHAWSTQRHLRIHAALALLATGLGLLLGIGPAQWAALLVAITLVVTLEILNTVVEVVVDMITTDFHPKAKVAKDLAAAAVLAAAFGAVGIGAVIFLPRLFELAVVLIRQRG